MRFSVLLVVSLFFSGLLAAQPIIYNDATTLVTGFWNGNGTLEEVSTDNPYEGSQHYRFSYNYAEYWAGIGLNMDEWNSGTAIDFTGYSHLRIAYRGLSEGEEVSLSLRYGQDAFSNEISIGGMVTEYAVVDLPLLAFVAGTNFDLSTVSEITLSVSSSNANGSGALYFDDIQLVTLNTNNETSATTWARANSMNKGVNLTNWLEAYWLIPFNAYPEMDRFTFADLEGFSAIGIDLIRLPVSFEHLAADTPPYTLDTSHPAFDLIDDAINWCSSLGMKLIIDMHHGSTTLTDANYQTELPRLQAIWEQVYDRYGYLDPEQFFFEIYNEPHAISNANFRTVAQSLVNTLRTAGSTHSIIVGGSGYNSANELAAFTPLDDSDIIYTFHFYDPYYFTHQGMSWTTPPYFAPRAFPLAGDEANVAATIGAAADWGVAYDAPVLLGEFGVSTEADADSRCNWINTVMDVIESHALPWIYWDATNQRDGFGFIQGEVVSMANVIPCFGEAMGLSTILAISELGALQLDCGASEPSLSWVLAADEPVGMEVQAFNRSANAWQTIQTLESKVEQVQYQLTLRQNIARYQAFRLRLRERDGKLTYSNSCTNPCGATPLVSAYPNPGPGKFYLQGLTTQHCQTEVYNALGELVLRTELSSSLPYRLDLSSLAVGQYWVRVFNTEQVYYQGVLQLVR